MRFFNRSVIATCLVSLLAVSLWTLGAFAAPRGNLIMEPVTAQPVGPTAEAAAGCSWIQYDDLQGTVYIWQSPDEYGDSLQFVRFSPSFVCTLKTVQFQVWGDPSYLIGTPGARVWIYSSDGAYPDTQIAYVDVPNASLALYPDTNFVDFSALNLVFDVDFHVVIQRLGTAADTLALFSDTTSVGVGRSGEFYGGAWELMVEGWGVDVNHIIRAELCCGDPPACTPGAQPEWTTLGGGFDRTYRSSAGIGDECQLTLEWINQADSTGVAGSNTSPFTNVVVADTLAFLTYYNFLACFDVRTGDTIWTARSAFPVVGEDMRCNVTVDDSVLYMGGGSFRSMNCLRVADGSTVWSFNTTSSPQPQGLTRFTPAVVQDSLVFFGTEETGRELFAFNKYTGALHPGWSTNPVILTEGGVYNAMASDGDSLLFVGTVTNGTTLTNGRLYAVRMADGTIKWELEDPSAIYLDPTLDEEGFSGSLAFENGILYYQSTIRDDASGFDHFPWDGSCGAIDVNAEDGSGAGILWVAPQAIGRPLYGGPVIGEGVVYVNCDGIFVGSDNPKGVIALNKANGARLWHQPLDEAGVPMPLTVTCETGTSPYVFAGTRGGLWWLVDGFSGDAIWSRTFSGLVHGTVVLDSQVLVSTRSSLVGLGSGQLASFRVTGANRPRMEVNQLSTFSTNALPGSGTSTVDTIYDALSNPGCANLTLNNFGVDTVSLSARVMSVEPGLAARAAGYADRMAADYLSFADVYPHQPNVVELKYGLLRAGLEEDADMWRPYVRDWTRHSVQAAADQVIMVETATPATVAPSGSLDIALRIDATGQIPRTSVINYVVLDNDDPDFFPEDTSYSTLGFPVIPVEAIFGFAQEQDTLRATDAMSQVTNHGAMGVGDDEIFYVEGDNTASMFDGTFIVSGKLDTTAHTAWDVYDWEEFQPDSFLTVVYDTALGTFTGTDTVTGTMAQAKYVDSIGFPDSATAYSYGVEVRETQVGFNLAGLGVESFKLVQQCVINRYAIPVDSIIYLGAFMDWDVESGANSVDTTHVTAWSTVFEYDPSGLQSAYGIIKLPAPGVTYRELDGSTQTASGFYSVYAVDNVEEVYPTGTFQPIVDYIHDYMSVPGLNSRSGFELNDDMSVVVTLDTLHLAANDTVWVRYAIFGTASGGVLTNSAEDAARSANMLAGFRRGDVNADGEFNNLDLTYLYRYIAAPATAPMPIPRAEQGDVNADGNVNQADVDYLEAYLYNDGPAPIGRWWW